MEDGSAAPVENIIVQSGALGFYQKRLFLCTCLLQALTVSTLIYASHCRPELAPPAPVSATNGALAHHSKCGSRSGMNENDLGLENDTSTVSETLLKHHNQSNDDVEHDVVVTKRSAGVTAPPAVLNSGGDDGVGEVSRGYENAARANIDESTESVDRDDSSVSSISTGTVTHKHRHHSSKHDDHGVRRKTSVKVSSDAVTQYLLNDVTNGGRLQTDVTPSGFYSSSPGVPEHPVYKNQDSGMYDSLPSDNVGESTTNPSKDPLKEKRDSSLSKDGAFDGTESGDITSTDHVRYGWSTESGDVTVSGDEDKNCEEEHKEEEPFYLTMTYLPAPEWMLDANNEQLAQYNAYCQAVGAMVGAAIGAMGADHVGRRRPLYVCFPFMLIAHCMSGCAVSWTMLAVLRFLVGFFAGACAVVSLVFPLEFIGTEWRDACVCSGVWMVGVVVISLELLVTRHWRYLAFISGGIGLPLVGTYFIASESARWLLCHQKFPDAEQTLKEIVSCNSSSVPDFLSLFDKSRACVVTNMHHKRYTFLDLFHSLEMTKWTFALVYTCLVGSSVYFCLFAKVKAMTGIVYLDNSIPFVIDLPLGWSAVVVNRCLGRRWCLFLYAVASGLVLLSVLVLHMTGNLSQVPSMLTGMAVFGKIGVSASLGLVFVIAVEMYPTVVRCMGVSVAVMAVSGGSILADAFVFLEAYHYTVPFVVFGAMMASVGFAGLLFPETICRPLPNILPCRHRTIPLHEGVRLVTNPWDVL